MSNLELSWHPGTDLIYLVPSLDRLLLSWTFLYTNRLQFSQPTATVTLLLPGRDHEMIVPMRFYIDKLKIIVLITKNLNIDCTSILRECMIISQEFQNLTEYLLFLLDTRYLI